jgi:hypothetical protein
MACAIVIGAGTARSATPETVGLLAIAAVAANMGRAAFASILRRRPQPGAPLWAVVWSLVGLLAVAALLLRFGDRRLLWLSPTATVFALGHVGLSRFRTSRRLDRTLAGEAVGAMGVALLAPAAYVVSGGPTYAGAWFVWLGATAQSISGIVHVRAIVGSLRASRQPGSARLHPEAVLSAAYHAAMAASLAAFWITNADRTALALTVAYAPLIVRSAYGLLPRRKPPRFVRVGMVETALSLWCAGWTAAALGWVLLR